MKKILYTTILAALASSQAYAQDAYDAANITTQDLNGTARYVGMGGALSALGADLTTIGTNPAGTALMRRNDCSVSFGGVFTSNAGAMGQDRGRFSFDNASVVFAFPHDNSGEGLQFVNFGVGYNKGRNHIGNLFTGIDLDLDKGVFSQTNQIADMAEQCYKYDAWGMLADMSAENTQKGHEHAGIICEDEQGYFGIPAKEANYHRATYGSSSNVNVNLSFNVSDQFYFGAAVGIHSLGYSRQSFYEELGADGNYYDFTNFYNTSGEGVDIKLGFICRPIATSPFRFGVSVHTPTWYRLTDECTSELHLNDEFVMYGSSWDYGYELQYHFRTPWKFNFSLGTTIGNNFAIGAEYELTDFSTGKYTPNGGGYSAYFNDINKYIGESLKAQHTFRIGAEYKPIQPLSLRLGYNYVTSPYYSDSYLSIPFDGHKTETDYTNWGAINRITAGIGYRWSTWYIDMAYQCQLQKGDFYAFDDYCTDQKGNTYYLPATSISNNRSQILFTLGFKF